MLSRHADWSSLRFRTYCVTGHYWLWLLFAHYFPFKSILAILCLYVCLSRTSFPYSHKPKYYWVPLTSTHFCLLSSSTKVSQTLLPEVSGYTTQGVLHESPVSSRLLHFTVFIRLCTSRGQAKDSTLSIFQFSECMRNVHDRTYLCSTSGWKSQSESESHQMLIFQPCPSSLTHRW